MNYHDYVVVNIINYIHKLHKAGKGWTYMYIRNTSSAYEIGLCGRGVGENPQISFEKSPSKDISEWGFVQSVLEVFQNLDVAPQKTFLNLALALELLVHSWFSQP